MRVPVLLYHSISDAPGDRFAVPVAAFERQMDLVRERYERSLTISEVGDALAGRRGLPPGAIAITFDDGFADNRRAFERLARCGLRATLYVTTGFLGRPGMLTPEALAETQAAFGDVLEVGAHSVSHPYLDELGERELSAEIRQSRARLEGLLERPVRSFAYPHGAYDRAVRDAVITAGFGSAAAVKNALSHARDDPLAIARYTVTRDLSLERFAGVLEGRGVPEAWPRERLRTASYRALRRTRRRLRVRSARRAGGPPRRGTP